MRKVPTASGLVYIDYKGGGFVLFAIMVVVRTAIREDTVVNECIWQWLPIREDKVVNESILRSVFVLCCNYPAWLPN